MSSTRRGVVARGAVAMTVLVAGACGSGLVDPSASPAPSASDAPRPPTAGVTAIAPSASAPPSENALAPLPPELTRPTGVSCRLDSASYASGSPVTLRVSRDGPEMGWFNPGVALGVTFGVGTPKETSAFAEAIGKGLTLSGHVDPTVLRLYPSRAMTLGPLVPKPAMRLAWASGREREATVELDEPSAHLAKPVSVTVPCDALSLDVLRFDPLTALFADRPRIGRWLPAHRKILVTEGHGSKAFATLDADDERLAFELGRDGDLAKVAIELHDAYLVGWVSARLLFDRDGGRGSGNLRGSSGRTRAEKGVIERRVCKRTLSVVVEVSTDRFTVGAADPGFVVDVLERAEPFSSVLVPNAGVYPAESVKLLARTAELDGCDAMPPPKPIAP